MLVGPALAALLVQQAAGVLLSVPGGPLEAERSAEALEGGVEPGRGAPHATEGAGSGARLGRPLADARRAALGLARAERLAVATVLTDDYDVEGYVQGVVALGASLLEHLTPRADRLLLVRDGLVLPEGAERRLEAVGWRLQSMPTIQPLHETYWRFVNQFSKLALWDLTNYSRVLYMDADTMARGELDSVFSTVFGDDQYLAASRDFVKGRFKSKFNMGVALVRPSRAEYERLVRLLREDSVPYKWVSAEQAFLQAVYPNFVELPFAFNGNTACEIQKGDLWGASLPDMRVVHFTITKPWMCRSSRSRACGQVGKWRSFLQRGEALAR